MEMIERLNTFLNQPNLDQLRPLIEVLTLVSMVTFVISIICIPLLVARLPRDYFQRAARRGTTTPRRVTSGYLFLLVFRNIAGMALLLAGVAMLFLPGQGIITMIIGLVIMQVPFKRKLIYRMTRPLSVRHGLDWLRTRMKREPFYW